MKYILKLLLTLLFLSSLANAQEFKKPDFDPRLSIDSRSVMWYNTADELTESAYNIGLTYDDKIKDYQLATIWYLQALNLNSSNGDAANNLGYIYDYINSQNEKAIKWYKKAIERESLSAMKNLSLLYYKKFNDNVKAVEYMLPLSGKKYTKKKVFALFRTHWKFDEATIKKGYEAQLKSKVIPEKLKYKGGI